MRLRSWENLLKDWALADQIADDRGWDHRPLTARERRQERRFRVAQWLHYYWPPTRGWSATLSLWWHYNVLRYPKPPPLDKDPVFQRLFGDQGGEDGSR